MASFNEHVARQAAPFSTANRFARWTVLALFAASPGCKAADGPQAVDSDSPASCADLEEEATPLNSLESVELGGREQWIQIRGQDRTKPVLLVLHGGPGTPLMPWIDVFQPAELEQNFVVVHWDQRGAGKSFDPTLSAEDMRFEDYVNDALELTDILRDRFNQDKIFLTGVSWGSALGFLTVRRDAEPFHAFIAAGERVHWSRSQTMGFDWVKARAEESMEPTMLSAIAAIEPFDPNSMEDIGAKNQGLDYFRGGDYFTPGLAEQLLQYALDGNSPYYSDEDVANYMPGRERSLAAVIPQALDYDLFRDFPASPIPVHFIVGEHDHQTPAALSREYFTALDAPQKSFVVIEDAGHNVILDAPDDWASALISVAESVSSGCSP